MVTGAAQLGDFCFLRGRQAGLAAGQLARAASGSPALGGALGGQVGVEVGGHTDHADQRLVGLAQVEGGRTDLERDVLFGEPKEHLTQFGQTPG
nr:hypothetical protein [Nakamurella panacisegetis]